MTGGQSTNSLLIELLRGVEALKVKFDMLAGLPDRLMSVETKLAALESKVVPPDMLETRFKSIEQGVLANASRITKWEERIDAVWDTLIKVGAVAVMMIGGAWAVFTYWKHG